MDRINGLPDEIVCCILSCLPIKEAALTSVLSKRWRNLFALSPNLHLDYHGVGTGQSFVDFVDRVLDVSGNFPRRKISIKCPKSIDSAHVIRWMNNVLKHDVLDLDIDIISGILMPREVFACKTIVELKLASGFEANIPDDAFLPSLKTLSLDSIWLYSGHDDCALGKLLSACPVLEELTILGPNWQNRQCCFTVSSLTLKRLTIKCTGRIASWDLTFDTPNLAYLEYSDLVPREYPIMNLESLVEAKIDLGSPSGYSNPLNLIKGLSNVEILELSSTRIFKVFRYSDEAIPVFINLLSLSITTASRSGLKFLPSLLEKSPKLETLVIKGPFHFNEFEFVCGCLLGDSCLSSCSVKVLKIAEYRGTIGELKQMRHFLEKLSCLELVKVGAYAITEKEKSRFTRYLLRAPISSKCKIQIKCYEET
ncbi:F-box protein At4g22280-like [Arabidopsis lyrata subsp. lyrata]|uniref:F-box protein At4g22280-like n=1 Tax=Arabidopsis lyrata subsp. lyrata TaxID=81972 RepID=UPI000A29E1CE|nr:F-box protein At4g22280-like [Arabidopsis lyrata subsp. lyrata]|eukprot:XP_020880554.1 F-box protein At4g22280-like [Arabidopsis lyrata subsp. lyrata]